MQTGRLQNVSVRAWVLTALTAVWMAVMFCFSAQTAQGSSAMSDTVRDWLLVLFPNLEGMQPLEVQGAKSMLAFLVRKAAHFSEYAVLSCLLMGTVRAFGLRLRAQVLLSLCIGVLYAVGDELHQYFVPGREARVYDVCVDTLGVLFGIFLVLAVLLPVYRYFKGKRQG